MSKHTEGPWAVQLGYVVVDQNPERFGQVVAGVPCRNLDEDAKNRRMALITSAPELLEALEECYEFAALFNHDTDASWAGAKRRILEVIAKAKGELK